MLIFIISNTEGVIVLVCPAIFWTFEHRVRTINNTINMFSWQINTCIEDMENEIKKEDMEEFYRFIEGQRETIHLKNSEETTREVLAIVPKKYRWLLKPYR